MSTLKVTTIQDSSGNNPSTTADIYSGRAKAWVNFNGNGTLAVRDSYNVSSVTDNAVGDYTVNFTTAFADTDYMWTGSMMSTAATAITRSLQLHRPTSTTITAPTTSSIRLTATDFSNASATDQDYVTVAIFR